MQNVFYKTNKVNHMEKKGKTYLVKRREGGSFCRFKIEKNLKFDKSDGLSEVVYVMVCRISGIGGRKENKSHKLTANYCNGRD